MFRKQKDSETTVSEGISEKKAALQGEKEQVLAPKRKGKKQAFRTNYVKEIILKK